MKEQAAIFYNTLLAMMREDPRSALFSTREVRARAGLSKGDFDSVANRLAENGILTMHYHDFPESLTTAERAQLVQDSRGTSYVGMALNREWRRRKGL